MSKPAGSWFTTFVNVVAGGLFGSILTTMLVGQWDDRREQRGALQSLVVVWHSVYLGNHRDRISEWLLTPDGVALRKLPSPERRIAMIEAVENNQAPTVAILEVASFFRTLDICMRDDRCDTERTHLAFGPSALSYYRLFEPLLRYFDCVQKYSGTEESVLRIALPRQEVSPCENTS